MGECGGSLREIYSCAESLCRNGPRANVLNGGEGHGRRPMGQWRAGGPGGPRSQSFLNSEWADSRCRRAPWQLIPAAVACLSWVAIIWHFALSQELLVG